MLSMVSGFGGTGVGELVCVLEGTIVRVSVGSRVEVAAPRGVGLNSTAEGGGVLGGRMSVGPMHAASTRMKTEGEQEDKDFIGKLARSIVPRQSFP